MPDRTPGSRRRAAAAAAVCAFAAGLLGLVLLRGGSAEARTAPAPSFTRDVAPIVREKCAGCHQLGGIAPFAFRTAHDVSSRATLVADAVRSRRMPPWPPGPASARFAGQERRTLTAAERDTLVRWALTGARVDGTTVGSPVPPSTKAGFGETTLRLGLPAAYMPRAAAGATDDYRCFLLDPKQTSDGSVTSVRIEPGQPKVVHHVILFRVAPGQVASAKGLDRGDSGAGWSCFGGTGLPAGDGGNLVDSLNDANWIAAWAPGWGGNRLPEHTGVSLPAGSQIVMQVHYNLLNGNAPDRSRALLTVAPASAELEPLQTMLLPGPVELACTKGEAGTLCDRNEALFDLGRKYGAGAAFTPAGLLILCRGNAANPAASAVSTCDRRISTPTTIHVAAGHMHLLGSSIRLELNPGTPRAKVLLDIPSWDFHWQNAYTLARSVRAEPGDVVRVTCRHDVSKRMKRGYSGATAPRYVLWGEGTTDEMCLGILQVTRG
jgi:hypothetical protein